MSFKHPLNLLLSPLLLEAWPGLCLWRPASPADSWGQAWGTECGCQGLALPHCSWWPCWARVTLPSLAFALSPVQHWGGCKGNFPMWPFYCQVGVRYAPQPSCVWVSAGVGMLCDPTSCSWRALLTSWGSHTEANKAVLCREWGGWGVLGVRVLLGTAKAWPGVFFWNLSAPGRAPWHWEFISGCASALLGADPALGNEDKSSCSLGLRISLKGA